MKIILNNAKIPFKEMVKIILGFKDIRNKFISQAGGIIDDGDYDNNSHPKKGKACIIF